METLDLRRSVLDWASAIERRQDVVYLDTETTGLGREDEVVDIALVDGLGRALFDSLVRPSRPMPPEVVAIHGITDELVSGSPTWPELYPRLRRLLCSYPCVVIYNASFDLRLIDQTCRRFGLSSLVEGLEAHCAMTQFARYNGRRRSLSGALADLGARPSFAHRALADAHSCRALVVALARRVQAVRD